MRIAAALLPMFTVLAALQPVPAAAAPGEPAPAAPAPELEPPPPSFEPPPPTLTPVSPPPHEPESDPEKEMGMGVGLEDETGDFAVPPPGPPPSPEELEGEVATLTLPDPGVAPDDGMSMLVLSGTTLGLTLAGFSAGLALGLQDEVPLDWLLPSTLVPSVGLLAFAGGGLYLGVDRRRSYQRWAAGYRVIGLPQGKGLRVGASFALLGALAMIPSGAYALSDQNPELGAPLLALGGAAALATPIMFAVAFRRQRQYARTGGWRRPALPPRPSAELRPLFVPLRQGVSLGLAGRF